MGLGQDAIEEMSYPMARATLRAIHEERARQTQAQADILTALFKALAGG